MSQFENKRQSSADTPTATTGGNLLDLLPLTPNLRQNIVDLLKEIDGLVSPPLNSPNIQPPPDMPRPSGPSKSDIPRPLAPPSASEPSGPTK